MPTRLSLALVACLGASALSAPAAAQPQGRQVIERVVAVVNDDAIWLSELRRRAVPFLERALSAPTQAEREALIEQLYGQLLTQLIDEELIQQAAADMQVRVTTEDVDRAIANVKQQSGLGDDEFWDAVRAQGFTERQYRQDVRRQLLRLKVLNTRARGRVNITEEDVQRRYQQMVQQANRNACFDVSLLKIDIDGQSATAVAAARDLARRQRRELTPRNFEASGGTHIGEVCQGQIQPELQEVLVSMQAGQISEPTRVGEAFFILHLREVVEGASNVPPYDQVKQDIYRQMLERAMAHQEELFIEELRRDAVVERRL